MTSQSPRAADTMVPVLDSQSALFQSLPMSRYCRVTGGGSGGVTSLTRRLRSGSWGGRCLAGCWQISSSPRVSYTVVVRGWRVLIVGKCENNTIEDKRKSLCDVSPRQWFNSDGSLTCGVCSPIPFIEIYDFWCYKNTVTHTQLRTGG